MPDGPEQNRRIIIDRATRLLEQSRTLRKMSEELLNESKDIRDSAADVPKRKRPRSKKKR